jgi:hypothetical protein
MNLLRHPMSNDVESPLAREGGQSAPRAGPREAFGELDDLMIVVEALCPKWPPRQPISPRSRFVL